MRGGRLAAEEIADRAYEARMQAIGRHFAQIRELTAQKYLVESVLITAAPEQRPALMRAYIKVAAKLRYLQGARHAS